MIAPKDFCQTLSTFGLDFYCGVPDSLLKSLCAYIDESFGSGQHVITANEGNAIGLAAGHYLGDGKPAVVYMQNSGLGNAINPLASLASDDVYGIPMLLVIGWRGQPGVSDEPQHVQQGRITQEQLQLMDIPYLTLDASGEALDQLVELLSLMNNESRPVALLVKKNTFVDYKAANAMPNVQGIETSREMALAQLLDLLDSATRVVSTTGKTSREVFELRQLRGEAQRDFLTVGAMGHTASIGYGLALAQPERKVAILDGDGSVLMHMGAVAVIGADKQVNLLHVLLNNGCHESVGGQPTVAGGMDFSAVAKGCGYRHYQLITDLEQLASQWPQIDAWQGPGLLEIKVAPGSRKDLGRPTSSPKENKAAFMQYAVVK